MKVGAAKMEAGDMGNGHASGRILVVDDEIAITDLLEMLLADAGYKVIVANDGRQALALAHEQPPDVVLTDVMMPFMDGLELLHNLQADARTAAIPVILMSAASHSAIGIEMTHEFLRKPFDIDDVVTCISRVMATASH
jgi:DNA-binding response OmpR family regulator